MKCRNCNAETDFTVIDLGSAPLSNGYLSPDDLDSPESWLPLRVHLCGQCWLVQAEDFVSRTEMFTDNYAYLSSASTSWLQHCETFANQIAARENLSSDSLVVEIASNDGYLLQFFQALGIPSVGVEPTRLAASISRAQGIRTEECFLGVESAGKIVEKYGAADLVVANNVLAHVPDLDDFVTALANLLSQDGILSVEFPRVTCLIDNSQFDTIYHEHYSYYSLHSVIDVFSRRGLKVFDAEEISTHGGSLRIYATRDRNDLRRVSENTLKLLSQEQKMGVLSQSYYSSLATEARAIANSLQGFLADCCTRNLRVAGYGAAAKGNTLCNFSGVRADQIEYVADRSIAKVGRFTPGSRIPIVSAEYLVQDSPDVVIVFPWNIADEVIPSLREKMSTATKFVTFVPSMKVH